MTDTFKFFIMDSPVVCMLIVFALILFVLIEFALLRLLFNIGDIKKQEKLTQDYNNVFAKVSMVVESTEGYRYTINNNPINKLIDLYEDSVYSILSSDEISALEKIYGDSSIGLVYILSQYFVLNKRNS